MQCNFPEIYMWIVCCTLPARYWEVICHFDEIISATSFWQILLQLEMHIPNLQRSKKLWSRYVSICGQLCACRWPGNSGYQAPSVCPQCTIRNRNVHISVQNCALWDMKQVQCGICEIGLLYPEHSVFLVMWNANIYLIFKNNGCNGLNRI